MLEIPLVFRQLVVPKAAVLNIALELVRILRAASCLFAFDAAPTRERTNAWSALVIDNVIRVAAGV